MPTLLAMPTGSRGCRGAVVGVPRFDTIFQADIAARWAWRLVPLLLSLVMVDFFDTIGTVTAIAERGRRLDADATARIPRLQRDAGGRRDQRVDRRGSSAPAR